HYIQIWSDQGNDLVRFRFKDIPELLTEYNGTQVHRSWWVNLELVKDHARDGRKLELKLTDKLTVPVSLSYKNAVLRELEG
ncbi:MAG: LytTR family DNA-binding domain-containing protein, partial [Gammaproteobacteria bacterium]